MQLAFALFRHGGARQGAGRPKTGSRMAHAARPSLSPHVPFHVTLRLVAGLPSLRSDHFTIVVDAIRAAHRDDGRITNFTVEHDHIHLMGEADDARSLTSLMKRIQIRIAKRLNRALGRRGRVFADRYHVQPLKTPRQVHHTLTYLLLNHRKHVWQRWQRELGPDWLDPYSTGPWFDGWDYLPDYFGFNAAGPNPTEPPRT
jgi:REP element-mobilizing transposase RayT